MIKDSIQNSAIYLGIHPGIDKALASIAAGDGHAPCLTAGDKPCRVRKAVYKVRVSQSKST